MTDPTPKAIEGQGVLETALSKLPTLKGATWTMLNWLAFSSCFAMVMGVIYGFQYSAKGALLAFLASLLGYAIGGIAGFLFGFPRYTESAAVQSVEDLRAAISSEGKAATQRNSPIRHSTNLERITDWLMTMIVGATVINLKDLAGWAEGQFRSLSTAIVYSDKLTAPAGAVETAAPGALLVLPFMVGGFLHMYLWARRYLPREWRDADDELYAKKVEEIAVAQQEQAQKLEDLQRGQYLVDPKKLKDFEATALRFDVDPAAIADVELRYRKARSWEDDPMEDFGPSTADGYRLSASVMATDDPQFPYTGRIAIERIDGASFSAAIALFFHNSFDEPLQIEPYVGGNKYEDQIWCSEGFTLGALVVEKRENAEPPFRTIRLALDLDQLPNLPKGFKSTGNE